MPRQSKPKPDQPRSYRLDQQTLDRIQALRPALANEAGRPAPAVDVISVAVQRLHDELVVKSRS
jgi:hypothetical protein